MGDKSASSTQHRTLAVQSAPGGRPVDYIANPDIHVTIFTDATRQDRHWGAWNMLKLGILYPAGTPTVQASRPAHTTTPRR